MLYKFKPYVLLKIDYKNGGSIIYPRPSCDHKIVCDDSHLYCLGGFNRVTIGANQPIVLKELWYYNFVTNQWKLIRSKKVWGVSAERRITEICTYKDVIMAYGGTGFPIGDSCTHQCYVFNSTGSIVKRILTLPAPRHGSAIVYSENYLYTVGGLTGHSPSCDVYRLDLINKIWECIYKCDLEIRDDPPGRYSHQIVADETYIYIIGGGSPTDLYDLNPILAFNLILKSWEYIQTKPDLSVKYSSGYPAPRSNHSCVQYKTDNGLEAVITGGVGDQSRFDDIWKLQFNTLEWKLIQNVKFPKQIFMHSSCTSGNGCMYVFGGIDVQINDGLKLTDNLYRIWTTIPKLSEMCWDAILYYSPRLDKCSRIELLKSGIPEGFANRVPD